MSRSNSHCPYFFLNIKSSIFIRASAEDVMPQEVTGQMPWQGPVSTTLGGLFLVSQEKGSMESQCGQVWQLKNIGRPSHSKPPCFCNFHLQEVYKILIMNVKKKKIPSCFLQEEEQRNLAWPQEKLDLLGVYKNLNDLGEAEYSTPASSSYQFPPNGDVCMGSE